MMGRSFPDFFPTDCPPTDATEAGGVYYRLVGDDPPSQDDFRTYAELGLRPKDDFCLRCGLSMFPTVASATNQYRHLRELFGDGLRIGPLVAEGELHAKDGKTKQTSKPPHETWWPCEDVDRHSRFVVVRDVRDVES